MSSQIDHTAMQQSLRSRGDLIYEVIRDRICLREYPEDHIIHEASLAAEFRVSRTPIRQALQRLVHEQFAETRNGVGTIVAREKPDLDDTWRFRVGLVTLIADSITLRATAGMESDLARLNADAEDLGPDAAVAAAWPIWRGMHEVRLAMIGDEVIRQMVDLMFYRTARLWCRWWGDDPAAMARLLVDELHDSREHVRRGDCAALFQRHAHSLRALIDAHAGG